MKQKLEQLYNATDNLVTQQFYKTGSDEIIGRTPEISIKIRNSGQIVKKFKDIFYSNLNLFLDGNYLDFLLSFKKIKGFNENYIKKIHKDLLKKIKQLKQTLGDFDTVILYTVVLSNLISKIRDLHFNDSIEEIMRRTKKKAYNLTEEDIQKELDNLFMRNDENVSILYNLSYLDALAESFKYKKVAHTCKIFKSKYMNAIVDLIIDSNN